ncbi:unnamed protein product [Ectocarpus sp. 12 AP-2014]
MILADDLVDGRLQYNDVGVRTDENERSRAFSMICMWCRRMRFSLVGCIPVLLRRICPGAEESRGNAVHLAKAVFGELTECCVRYRSPCTHFQGSITPRRRRCRTQRPHCRKALDETVPTPPFGSSVLVLLRVSRALNIGATGIVSYASAYATDGRHSSRLTSSQSDATNAKHTLLLESRPAHYRVQSSGVRLQHQHNSRDDRGYKPSNVGKHVPCTIRMYTNHHSPLFPASPQISRKRLFLRTGLGCSFCLRQSFPFHRVLPV